MADGTVATLALYCAHCGKLHMQDVSRFVLHANGRMELRCQCGRMLASLAPSGRQILLRIPCSVCRKEHIVCLEMKEFWRGQFEKLYCRTENMELGYWGAREFIVAMVDECKREFYRSVEAFDAEGYVEDPQVMFEILNRIHDLAEQEGVYCACGSCAIEVQLLPDGVSLGCMRCGSVLVIPASSEGDVHLLEHMDAIELPKPHPYRHLP